MHPKGPFLDPAVDAVSYAGEGIILRAPGVEQVFDDPLFLALIDALEASADVDDLADEIMRRRPQVSMIDVYYAIEYLATRGFLRLRPEDAQSVGYAAGTHPIGRRVARQPQAVRIVDLAGRPDVAEPLGRLLAGAGHRDDGAGSIVVAVVGAGDTASLDELLAAGLTVIAVTVAAQRLVLGPVRRLADDVPCHSCLEHWLRFNGQLGDGHATFGAGPSKEVGRLLIDTTVGVFGVEIVRLLAGDLEDAAAATVMTYEPLSRAIELGALIPSPRCDRCRPQPQPPGNGAPASRILSHANGSRSEAPDATLRRLLRYVNPVVGVLPRLMPVSAHPVVHSYVVGANAALALRRLADRRNGVRSQSGGKGRTALQAQVSAIGEGLERYAGVFQGTEPLTRAAYDRLPPGEAIHPDDVQLFSERQFADRGKWNREHDSFNRVLERFDPEAEIAWARMTSLDGGADRLLPAALCYYNLADTRACGANSNGVAAGNTTSEATLQGLLELVERDSVALWWYNRTRRPRIDLQAFEDPYLSEVCQFYGSVDRDLWVLDLTSDLGIPAAAAVSSRRDPPHHIMFGFGAHTSARVAVERAVTELNQFISAVVDLSDGTARTRLPELPGRDWYERATLEEHPYLVPEGITGARDLAPASSCETIEDELGVCLQRLERAGLSAHALDLSRPEIELSVVRVVVPGLRHFWARLAPGRLYDAPVSQGLLAEPMLESQLNPVAMFL